MSVQSMKELDAIPIHRLPIDILVLIFLDLRDSSCFIEKSSVKRGKWNWISITHVCRYWRTTALGTPSLWSHLYSFNDCRKMEAFLQRSKDADLSVFARVVDKMNDGSYIEEYSCLRMALQNPDRIGCLHVIIEVHESLWKQLQELLSLPAPKLKEFSVSCVQPSRQIQMPQFTPLLRKLELRFFSSIASIFPSAKMSTLHLRDITTFSLSEILSTLASCQGLKDLVLLNVGLVDSTDTSLVRNPVPLPQLAFYSVKFTEPYRKLHDELMSTIATPMNTNWKVSSVADKLESFFEMKFLDVFLKNIPKCDILTIMISPLVLALWCRLHKAISRIHEAPHHCGLYLAWEMPEDAHAVRRRAESLIRTSNWRHVKQASILANVQDFEEEDFISLLSSLCSLKFLEVDTEDTFQAGRVSNSTAESCLRALAHLITDEEVICPRLEEFTLKVQHPITTSQTFILHLSKALQVRKRLGFDIKKVYVHCPLPIEADMGALSDFAGNISWIDSEVEDFIIN